MVTQREAFLRVKREVVKMQQINYEAQRALTVLKEKKALLCQPHKELDETTSVLRSHLSTVKKCIFDMKRTINGPQCNQLIEPRQLAISLKESVLQEQTFSSENVVVSDDGRRLFVNGFTYILPKYVSKGMSFNSTVSCEGCAKMLPFQKTIDDVGKIDQRYSLDYFIHILTCEEYIRFGITRTCGECELIFRNAKEHHSHQKRVHHRISLEEKSSRGKPIWMSRALYKKASRSGSSGQMSCPGCNSTFETKSRKASARHKSNGVIPELSYHVHCVEQCKQYKKLDLLRKCHECGFIFLNQLALDGHNALKHPSSKEPVRSWMSGSLKEGRVNIAYNSTIACKGCGETFPMLQSKKDVLCKVHRSYYIHCIEECEQYKALSLATECLKCKCKFISKRALAQHKCRR